MSITFEINRSKGLTIFTVTGEVVFDELIHAIEKYIKTGPTPFEIYDFRNGTGESFTSEQIDRLIERGKDFVESSPGGSKTALVVSKDIDYGLSKVYQALGEIGKIPWETEVFRSMDKAYQWLNLPLEESGE